MYRYGHYSRNNWARNPNSVAVMDKLDEHFRLKEQLGDDEVSPGIDLLFEMNEVLVI